MLGYTYLGDHIEHNDFHDFFVHKVNFILSTYKSLVRKLQVLKVLKYFNIKYVSLKYLTIKYLNALST